MTRPTPPRKRKVKPADSRLYLAATWRAGRRVRRELITIGAESRLTAHPRECLRGAIVDEARAVTFIRGGAREPWPVSGEWQFIRRLADAALCLGILIEDYQIVVPRGFRWSARDCGYLHDLDRRLSQGASEIVDFGAGDLCARNWPRCTECGVRAECAERGTTVREA